MTKKKRLPSLPAEVPQFVIDKADALLREIRPLGHPRAARQDIVGALIDAATARRVAAALEAYNPKLGRVLNDLESSN
jgi:hypothetical protein